MANNGLLVIFSGPSGAGKGTVMKQLLSEDDNLRLSVSATTRAPRPGEVDGKDYYFIPRDKFLSMCDSGEMLESAEYCGNFYGTPASPVDRWLSEGHDVFLEIEVQGAAKVMTMRTEAIGIFILPPSLEELERRLRSRGTEKDETVRKRLETARREISESASYDYVVVNDSVENAAEKIREILTAEKCKSCRSRQMIERMLKHD